jgi:hypothetical protein
MKHIKLFEDIDRSFSWDELSPEAKKKALDTHRDINLDGNWFEDEIVYQEEALENDGVGKVEIMFEGFYSQGDGASFTGHVENMKVFLKVIGMRELPQEVEEMILISFKRGSSRYYHEHTVSIEIDKDTGDKFITTYPFGPEIPMEYDLDQIMDEIESLGEKWRLRKCQEIYSALEREYDSLRSDESVEDTLTANDYEWDEEGNIL